MRLTAVSTSHAPLASTRIRPCGPIASRTAATRSTSPGSPTLTLTSAWPPARAAASSGPTAGTRALTRTTWRTGAGHGPVAASSAARRQTAGSHG
jgi:hypothetical protein